MTEKIIQRWEDGDGRKRMSILRGTHTVHKDGLSWPRRSAVTIWPEEQVALESAILEDLGLMTLAEHRRRLGIVYDEVERRDAQIRRLEQELAYAATGEEEDEGETND